MAAELEVIAAAVAGAVAGGAVKPILSPVEALADHWKQRVSERLERTRRRAERKRSGEPLEIEERSAFKALTEAAFTDDAIVQEYLAGILAGTDPRGDNAVPVLAQLARLSSLQLRIHFMVYRTLWGIETGEQVGRRGGSSVPHAMLFLPASSIPGDHELESPDQSFNKIESALRWLRREDLLSPTEARATEKGQFTVHLSRRGEKRYQASEAGFVVGTTSYGIEIFLWGCGSRYHEPHLLKALPRSLTEFDPPIPHEGLQEYTTLPRID